MKIVYFEELKHYPLMVIWWSERGFPPTPLQMLSKTGVVAESDDGLPLAAGFLYATDSGLAQISHLVGDKLISREERGEALDRIILSLSQIAKGAGFVLVSGATNIPGLVERYKRLGFIVCDENVSHLAKEL